MIYVHVDSLNVVTDIISDIDESFPGVPVEDRYSRSFLSECKSFSDEEFENLDVAPGYTYDEVTGTFIPPEREEQIDVGVVEEYTITESEIEEAYGEGVNNAE